MHELLLTNLTTKSLNNSVSAKESETVCWLDRDAVWNQASVDSLFVNS